jgi:hypothetical protein
MPVAEQVTAYAARPDGSESKLNTWGDGLRILNTILKLFRYERPLAFFGFIATVFVLMSIILAIPLFITFIETGLVPRFPTAILATGLMILSALNAMCGVILDTVVRGRLEVRRLAYLAYPAPSGD